MDSFSSYFYDIINTHFARDFDSGTDVAGEVVEIGPQVKDFKAGDKVIAKLNNLVPISNPTIFNS